MQIIEKVARFKPGETILLNIERIAAKTGIEEEELLGLYVTVKNGAFKKSVASTPYSDRVLLLPQCLRPRDCPAELGDYGYICTKCGRCRVEEILQEAESLGYGGAYILSGGRLVEKIFKNLKPKACIGVACLNELVLGSFIANKFGVAIQAIKLKRDGCVNTDVDWNSVLEAIKVHSTPKGLYM